MNRTTIINSLKHLPSTSRSPLVKRSILRLPSSSSSRSIASSSSSPPSSASSCPPGTVLKNLNFLKTRSDPIALEDAEYPAWLWKLLEPEVKAKRMEGVEESVGERLAREKKELRRKGKIAIKGRNTLSE